MRMYLHTNDGTIAFGGYDLCGLADIYVTITRENFKFTLAGTKSFRHTGMYKSDERY